MQIEEIRDNLEAIYLDYFDGLYTDQQLKMMLLNLYKKCDIDITEWSELILDAQWKHATDQDYKDKIKQLKEDNKEEDE